MSSISLEEVVKSNLAGYEARYDANDWSRMESMLVTTPDSSPFNWKPVLITFFVLIVLGGGYALYTTIDFSKPAEKALEPTPPPVVKKQISPPAKKTVPPTVTPPVMNEDSLKKFEEAAIIAKAEAEGKESARKEIEERRETEERRESETRKEKEGRKEKIAEREKEPEVKKERKELSKEDLELRRARRRALAASDSGKTNESKEKKEPEKKEKTKSSSSFGLNIFSTLNADSLKKYQERSKKDTVK